MNEASANSRQSSCTRLAFSLFSSTLKEKSLVSSSFCVEALFFLPVPGYVGILSIAAMYIEWSWVAFASAAGATLLPFPLPEPTQLFASDQGLLDLPPKPYVPQLSQHLCDCANEREMQYFCSRRSYLALDFPTYKSAPADKYLDYKATCIPSRDIGISNSHARQRRSDQ